MVELTNYYFLQMSKKKNNCSVQMGLNRIKNGLVREMVYRWPYYLILYLGITGVIGIKTNARGEANIFPIDKKKSKSSTKKCKLSSKINASHQLKTVTVTLLIRLNEYG